MNNLQKLLYLGSNSRSFIETFPTTVTPVSNNTLYTNFYNDWNWISNGGNTTAAHIDSGGFIQAATNAGGNCSSFINMYRTKEGYNINRSFELSYSFSYGNSATVYSYIYVAIGGNNNITNISSIPTGLCFRARMDYYDGQNFSVLNNGAEISTNYTLNANTKYYVFIKKLGNVVYYTVNTTGVKPTNYDYNVTMTDNTSASNSLMLYCWSNTVGDGNSPVYYKLYAPSILLY